MLNLNKEQINQLACEFIDIFNRFGLDDYYGIVLKDRFYDSHNGWTNKIKNIEDYIDDYYKDKWSMEFGIIYDSLMYDVFGCVDSQLSFYDAWNVTDEYSKNIYRCCALLRRLYKRYNLEYVTNLNMVLFRNKDIGTEIDKIETEKHKRIMLKVGD